MSFSDFLSQAWGQHATDTVAVFDRLDEGARLATTGAELASLAGLVLHVAGEHLGRFDAARQQLEALRAHPAYQEGSPEAGVLWRSLAALALAQGQDEEAARLADRGAPAELPAASGTARVHASAAALLAGQERYVEARTRLGEAVALLAYGPDAKDPAARALAVTANNLAASLEERAGRGPEADATMVFAAQQARRYWEIAGTWLHVERAEYRLSRAMAAAGRLAEAEAHARLCLETCEANQAPAEERFFGQEALALALIAAGRPDESQGARDAMAALLPQVPADWAEDCAATLAAVDTKRAV